MKNLIYILLFLAVYFQNLNAANNEIFIDGNFNDWNDAETTFADEIGDGSSAGVDFANIKISDSENFLYIYFEVTNEISLQNNENVRLYLDVDNNFDTGKEINDIGADIIWNFYEKEGVFYSNKKTDILHQHLGLYPSPTVTSDRFEIAIDKSKEINGKKIFNSDIIKLVFKDTFDTAPDDKSIEYKFTNNIRVFPTITYKKPEYSDIRLVSYNILFDNPFKEESSDAFARIFKSLDADIYLLQEMYDHDAEDVQELINSISDSVFYVEKLERDLIYIGKYPLLDRFQLDGSGAFFIDTPDDIIPEMMLINAHLKCCNYDYVRLKQTNQIMNYIDLLKKGGQIRKNTPFVIAGDMNFVGTGEQLDMLLNGNSKGKPDWDNTSFADVILPVPNMPVNFTWYDTGSKYAPGRLDFVIYSDSILKIANKFVLYTSTMDDKELKELGLKKDDSLISSDHLPLVIDFNIK
jgi:endonuclease/exonuclease/phosphatase family metal-dependent hydrolase